MKLQLSWQSSEKYSNIKFHENPSGGNWDVPCGWMDVQTDRHDTANSSFPHLQMQLNTDRNNILYMYTDTVKTYIYKTSQVW